MINALPFVGTVGAVNLMKELIIKKNIGLDTINFWVTSFSFIPRPDRHTVHALATLLEYQNEIPDAQFILSFSSVIHAFCNNYGTHCSNLEAIKNFVNLMEKYIYIGCIARPHDIKDIKQVKIKLILIYILLDSWHKLYKMI